MRVGFAQLEAFLIVFVGSGDGVTSRSSGQEERMQNEAFRRVGQTLTREKASGSLEHFSMGMVH